MTRERLPQAAPRALDSEVPPVLICAATAGGTDRLRIRWTRSEKRSSRDSGAPAHAPSQVAQRIGELRPGVGADAIAVRLGARVAIAQGEVLQRALSNIDVAHLEAALELQAYTIRSAAWALEPDTGDPLAAQIHTALPHAPDGLTRTQLRDLLHRNTSARRLDQALANLAAAGKADRQRILTTGRPAELWTAREA